MSNLNSVRVKEVEIILDKPRHLCFDLNAYAEIEDVYGKVDALMEQMQEGSVKATRFLLWAGLIREDESLTLRDVGKLLDLNILTEITKHLTEAITGSQVPDGDQEGNQPNPLPTT